MPPEAALLATAVAASLGFGIERAVAIDRAHPAGAPASCAAGPRGAASVDIIFPEDCPAVLTTSITPAHQPGGRGPSQPRIQWDAYQVC